MATTASSASSQVTASSPVSSPPARPPIDPNSAQLYINNISFSTNEAALSAWIADRIGVTPSAVNIIINKRTQKSKGYGFVTIPKTSVDKALTLNGDTLDDRPVSVARAVDLTDEERQEKRDKRDEKRRAARSKREADRAAAAAAAGNGTASTDNNPAASPNARTQAKAEKKQASASTSAPSSSSKPKTPRPPPAPRSLPPNTTQLYVSNLAFDTTEADLRTLFAQTLGVSATPPSDPNDSHAIHVEVVPDRWRKNKTRGYAFVTVNNSLVDKALAVNGAELHDRKIKVALAKERKAAEQIETDGGQADDGTQAAATASSSTDGVEPVTVHRRPFRAPRRNRAKKAGEQQQQQGEEKTTEAATAKNGDNSADHTEQQPASSTATANGEGKKKRRYPPRKRGASQNNNNNSANSNSTATSSTNSSNA